MDDDIVALVTLDMEAQGLLPIGESKLWASRMSAESLYSEHWLLAYEAYEQGWLPSVDADNYVAADPFFSVLSQGNVHFYDAGDTWEDGYSDYSDGDDVDDSDDSTDEDDLDDGDDQDQTDE